MQCSTGCYAMQLMQGFFLEEHLAPFANKQEHKRTKNAIKSGLVLVVVCLVMVGVFVCWGFLLVWGFIVLVCFFYCLDETVYRVLT